MLIYLTTVSSQTDKQQCGRYLTVEQSKHNNNRKVWAVKHKVLKKPTFLFLMNHRKWKNFSYLTSEPGVTCLPPPPPLLRRNRLHLKWVTCGVPSRPFMLSREEEEEKKLLCILVNTEEFDLIQQEVQKVTVDLVVGGAFFFSHSPDKQQITGWRMSVTFWTVSLFCFFCNCPPSNQWVRFDNEDVWSTIPVSVMFSYFWGNKWLFHSHKSGESDECGHKQTHSYNTWWGSSGKVSLEAVTLNSGFLPAFK